MRLPFCTHRFVLSGLNLERFLSAMNQQEIPLLSVRRQDHRTLECECFSADLSIVSSFVQEKGWRMEKTRAAGLSAVWERMKKRPGISIGALLSLVIIFTLSQFVWRIDVQQAGPYHADLVSFLHQSGYHAGIPRKSVDARALESALSYRYPQIAWFQVYVTNMTLTVQVSHGVPMPELAGTEAGDVVALRNGIIHSIRVSAGTPVVKVGDVVRPGDVLIRGEERGRDEQLLPVRASGVVAARCWDSVTVTMPMVEIISTPTGREASSFRLHTPWFDYSLGEAPHFLASDLTITQFPLAGVFFPVFLQKITHREVAMEYALRNEQKVREEAAQAALKQLKTMLFGDDIIDKWVDYCMIEDDILAVTATAERLVDIGVFSAP